jgi:hypothetical protein
MERICIDCDAIIPKKRVKIFPSCVRCVACQSMLEALIPSNYKRRIDEGIAGTREGYHFTRQRQRENMLKRYRE